MKLNFGCGEDYKEGWINVDINPNVKTDLLLDGKLPLPYPKNTFDYILADNVIEHFEPKEVKKLLMEFNRILVPGGKLEIYTPHFTGILTKYLGHYKGYGINSFCDERDIFTVTKEELFLISRCKTAGYKGLRFLNSFNFLFNLSPSWQQFYEKFWWGGFEEYHAVFLAVKNAI